MRSLRRACLALALLVLVVSSTSAQLPGSADPTAQGGTLLLMMPAVRQELNVTRDQAPQLTRALISVLSKYGPNIRRAMADRDRTKLEQLRGKMNEDAH